MKSRRLLVAVSVLCFAVLVGLGGKTALGQPSIKGEWLFDISGVEQGGAVVVFDDSALHGYGVTLQSGYFEFSGSYTIGAKGVVSGTFNLAGGSESFTGKADKKGTKLTIKTSGPSLKGIKLPSEDPVIPPDWTVKVSGLKGAFTSFTISHEVSVDDNPNARLYKFSAEGTFQDIDTMNIHVEGKFFLTSKSVAYGFYSASITVVGVGTETQTGVLSGKINLSSGKFSLKVISDEGDRITLSGVAK